MCHTTPHYDISIYYTIYYHPFSRSSRGWKGVGWVYDIIIIPYIIILPLTSIRSTEMDCTCHTTPHYDIYLYVMPHLDLHMEDGWLCLTYYTIYYHASPST